jgi:hypothetical protein
MDLVLDRSGPDVYSQEIWDGGSCGPHTSFQVLQEKNEIKRHEVCFPSQGDLLVLLRKGDQ